MEQFFFAILLILVPQEQETATVQSQGTNPSSKVGALVRGTGLSDHIERVFSGRGKPEYLRKNPRIHREGTQQPCKELLAYWDSNPQLPYCEAAALTMTLSCPIVIVQYDDGNRVKKKCHHSWLITTV